MQTEEDLKANLEDKVIIGHKRTRSRYHKARQEKGKAHFVSMMHQINEEKQRMEEMDEDELREAQAQKAKLKAMFRADTDEDMYYPIIVKCAMAGQLETIMTETQKIVGTMYQVQLIDTGVGPITEADISQASSTNATIIAFDVGCPAPMQKRAEAVGITIRLHKLIYKFTDDLKDIVHDIKLKEAIQAGQNTSKDIQGSA